MEDGLHKMIGFNEALFFIEVAIAVLIVSTDQKALRPELSYR